MGCPPYEGSFLEGLGEPWEVVIVNDESVDRSPALLHGLAAADSRYQDGEALPYGIRQRRDGETWFKRSTAAAFYPLLRAVIGIDVPQSAGDFRLMSRQTVLASAGPAGEPPVRARDDGLDRLPVMRRELRAAGPIRGEDEVPAPEARTKWRRTLFSTQFVT
jgi:glycosyltransferase involved in cell wall biosynthesis